MFGLTTYSPNILLQFLTALFLLALGVYSWRRRNVPGALPFAAGCLFALLWVSGSVMEYAAGDPETQLVWFKFQAAWQLPATLAITFFVFEYVCPGRWLTPRHVALLALPPLVYLFLIATNDLHHWVWSGFVWNGSIIPQRGPATWFSIAYGYVLALVEIALLIWLYRRSPDHRWPVALMLAGILGASAIYGVQTSSLSPPGLPLDVLAIAFVFLMYATALFAFRIFNPLPLARQMAIEQLQAGVLVLDPQGRITSLNPAAERFLKTTSGQALGKSMSDLIPGEVYEQLADREESEVEFSLGDEGQAHFYILSNSRLRDWRGLEVGRLLLMHDVTEQRRAQAQIIEQQRALAMLQERDQLARELHDSTGQVLSYVSLQAQAIRKHLQDGSMAKAESQLTRLANVAGSAHEDVRESILSLRAGSGMSLPFFTALQEYLDAYSDNYGLRTVLIAPEVLAEIDFASDVGVQLMRVIAEAVTNARKHSAAACVEVSLVHENHHALITIADDGQGFDTRQSVAGQDHFGLAFMRERMAQVGGDLEIESELGKGTRIKLRVPIAHELREVI